MKSDFAEHTFDEGKVTKQADYGVEGEKTFTCTVCGYSYTQDIDAVDAKDNEIKLAEGKMLDKTYDGKVVDTTDKFSFNGDGAVTVMFKVTGAADDTYTADAPKNAGEYTVKVSVKDTAEWKAATQTFDFAIAKKELTGATTTKAYDGNATIVATPDGVVAGDAVTATITMTSKNIDATVQSVMLEGADKDNYLIDKADVVASITKKDITEDIPNMNYFYNGTTSLFLYNGSTGSYGTIHGDAVIIRIIFESKDAGTTKITGVSISGADGGNYRIDHAKLSGTIIQTSLELVGINFKIFKFGIEVREEANRGPRVTNSTKHAELTIGTTYELPKAPNTHNLGKKHFLKVNLPQNGYYQITKQKFYSSDSIKFYDEQGKQITPLKCTNRTHDSATDTYSDYIYTIANFSDSVKVIYISITVYDKNSVNGITVSSAKNHTASETGKYLRYETKYFAAQLNAGKITINENGSTVLSARKLTYKVYGADLNEITMNADGTFDIPANGKYLIEVSNLTTGDIESVTFGIVAA